jgi:hypothetical protein
VSNQDEDKCRVKAENGLDSERKYAVQFFSSVVRLFDVEKMKIGDPAYVKS